MIAQAVVFVVGIIVLVLALSSFGMNREYHRAVVFRLGRIAPLKGPGWYWLIPLIDRAVRVDMRTVTVELDTQETVTRDGVAVKVNAVLWFRADDAVKVIISVQQWSAAVVQAAETALRDAIGQSDLDQLLKERIQVNARLLEILGRTVARWGVVIDAVEIKNLDIPEEMQRAIAREAEAIREKRARIIKAEGEREAARTLAEAAQMLGGGSAGLELRRLQTLSEIGAEHNSTIVAMIPSDLLHAARALSSAASAD
jgi:regulator of protease activity HflC (stomatin/prohibitin superfamily)